MPRTSNGTLEGHAGEHPIWVTSVYPGNLKRGQPKDGTSCASTIPVVVDPARPRTHGNRAMGVEVGDRRLDVRSRLGVMPSTVTRTSVVDAELALSADWRQHHRRAATWPASSMKMTSPGSGRSVAPEPRSVNDSSPVASRTVRPP